MTARTTRRGTTGRRRLIPDLARDHRVITPDRPDEVNALIRAFLADLRQIHEIVRPDA